MYSSLIVTVMLIRTVRSYDWQSLITNIKETTRWLNFPYNYIHIYVVTYLPNNPIPMYTCSGKYCFYENDTAEL